MPDLTAKQLLESLISGYESTLKRVRRHSEIKNASHCKAQCEEALRLLPHFQRSVEGSWYNKRIVYTLSSGGNIYRAVSDPAFFIRNPEKLFTGRQLKWRAEGNGLSEDFKQKVFCSYRDEESIKFELSVAIAKKVIGDAAPA